MRWLSRLTAICNFMFVLALMLRFFEITLPQWLTGTILVLGWVPICPTVNLAFIFMLIFYLLTGKRSAIPVVLTIFNLVIAAVQFFFYFIIPGV